jgi:hypothetical protein
VDALCRNAPSSCARYGRLRLGPEGLGGGTHCHDRLTNPAASGWLDWRILRGWFRYDVPLSLFIQQAGGCIDVSFLLRSLVIYEELVLAL